MRIYKIHMSKFVRCMQRRNSLMDSIFLLDEGDRSAFLHHMMNSFGCTFICLWSYVPEPSNCLISLDGLYKEQSDQPSSSTGSRQGAHKLFYEYRGSMHFLDTGGRVPGFAFKNNLPYLELKLASEFRRLTSSEVQLQFYQEAGIKTLVFMGCSNGEIELGISDDHQTDLETKMKNWFPADFARQIIPREQLHQSQHAIMIDQSRPLSSSSSSLRSLSVESPQESPHQLFKAIPTSTPTISPLEEAVEALSQIRTVQFPTIGTEDAAMTQALVAVISSPATTSTGFSSSSPSHVQYTAKSTAFESYRSPVLSSTLSTTMARNRRHGPLFKRAVAFFKNLNLMRLHQQQRQQQGSYRPMVSSSTQLHHMISERRRREKLNESFQVLRSLLPPGSKKDKASVLSNTTEYLTSLKSQVEELKRQNRVLEAQILPKMTQQQLEQAPSSSSASAERVGINITRHSSESTSEERAFIMDLNVRIRAAEFSLEDLVIRLLDFLKGDRNLSLLSIEANTRVVAEATAVHEVIFRINVEGDEFDQSTFQEAVRRLVDDLAR